MEDELALGSCDPIKAFQNMPSKELSVPLPSLCSE